MTDQLIDEVDAALRRERIEAFWKRFGQSVVAGSVGVLLLTIGAVIWQNHRAAERRAWTSHMLAARSAIEQKQYGEAARALEAAETEADENLRVLTRLWRAQISLKNKDRNAALTALRDMGGADVYGDFARLLEHAAGRDGGINTEDAFRFTAGEMDAAGKLASGKTGEARALLQSLADDALTPGSLRARAKLLLSGLAAEESPRPAVPAGE